MAKWYTCTPLSFKGDEAFFCRDSGLLCRGLQSLGFESRAVMPDPDRGDDKPDVLRTEFENLSSPAWWGELGLTGVLIYSWADPKYNGIVSAIKRAGLRLFVNVDNGGIISPYSGLVNYSRDQYERKRHVHTPSVAFVQCLFKVMCRSMCVGMIDYPRMKHLAQADLIGTVSPIAAGRIKRYCQRLGYGKTASKICVIPHPIPSYTSYHGEPKEAGVVAVGRWDDTLDKNTSLFAAIIREMATRRWTVPLYVFGGGFEPWMEGLKKDLGDRANFVNVMGRVRHEELIARMKTTILNLCTSRSESFNLAAAEALCCGCSIVGPNRPSTPSFSYFISQNSGTLAESYNAKGFVDALQHELMLWKSGRRSAESISAAWCERLHERNVVESILRHLL